MLGKSKLQKYSPGWSKNQKIIGQVKTIRIIYRANRKIKNNHRPVQSTGQISPGSGYTTSRLEYNIRYFWFNKGNACRYCVQYGYKDIIVLVNFVAFFFRIFLLCPRDVLSFFKKKNHSILSLICHSWSYMGDVLIDLLAPAWHHF